ncbi:hypothetical protein [Thalassospira sp.]|uniref:hypothetical protein n=1 Tax=Thalassospira sp. TaxID=1912094 RepID=UPI003AA95C1D
MQKRRLIGAERQRLNGKIKRGAPDASAASPDSSAYDTYYIARSEVDVIQFDPVSDDTSNVALYPTFQADFREHQPPLLAIQSQNGSVFMPPGAKVYRRDMPAQPPAPSSN